MFEIEREGKREWSLTVNVGGFIAGYIATIS